MNDLKPAIAHLCLKPNPSTSHLSSAWRHAVFTLAGAKLDLAAVPKVLPVALLIFLARAVGIIFGASLGCYASRQSIEWTKLSWMAFMTQVCRPRVNSSPMAAYPSG